MRLPPAEYVDGLANPLVGSGRILWRGYAVQLPTGAQVNVYDGMDPAGQLLAQFVGSAGGGTTFTQWPAGPGVFVERGLFVEVAAGSPTCVTMFVTPETTIAGGVSVIDEPSYDL